MMHRAAGAAAGSGDVRPRRGCGPQICWPRLRRDRVRTRERGPLARIPGEARRAARMRASGPRSPQGPTPRLVSSRPRAGDRRVPFSHGTTLGARAAGPHPRGGAPGGADAGRRPALPARTNTAPCSFASACRRPPGSLLVWNDPGSAGRRPASPGARAQRRGCGPAARAPGKDQHRALFLRVRVPATAGFHSYGTNARGSAATGGGWSIRGRCGWVGGGADAQRQRSGGPAMGRFHFD